MRKPLRQLHPRGVLRISSDELPVFAWSLGCPKNRADTEHLLGSLGLPIRTVASAAAARLVFINTCAFIEPAARESIRAIIDIGQSIKRLKRKPLLVVAGCLPGRYGIEALRQDLPEVDLWLDLARQNEWPAQINARLKLDISPTPGRLFSSLSYLWLKIADGCQHQCSFCAIPSIRGQLHSESLPFLLDEAKKAVAGGVKEINLVAQDVTAWGRDLMQTGEKAKLPQLVRRLAEIPGLAWLRLLYLYPGSIDRELLDVLSAGAPILPYLDIPLQHSEKKILKSMGRAFAGAPERLMDEIHQTLPQAALRATFMVGFPGETDADFRNLCEFVRQTRFHNLGVFAFQPEEGTRAAEFPNQVPPEIAAERKAELLALQAGISAEILAENLNNSMDVLVDRDCGEMWPGLHAGRVWFQAPEVDGVTYISGSGVEPGVLIRAEIVDTQVYDMSALA